MVVFWLHSSFTSLILLLIVCSWWGRILKRGWDQANMIQKTLGNNHSLGYVFHFFLYVTFLQWGTLLVLSQPFRFLSANSAWFFRKRKGKLSHYTVGFFSKLFFGCQACYLISLLRFVKFKCEVCKTSFALLHSMLQNLNYHTHQCASIIISMKIR